MSIPGDSPQPSLHGRRVALVGHWAAMPRREAARLVRERGGLVVEDATAEAEWVFQGEAGNPLPIPERHARVFRETELYGLLGLVDVQQQVHSLYTPALLADLVGVAPSVVRQWQRHELLRPTREVKRLAYFDFAQASAARQLAEFARAGLTARNIQQQLAGLRLPLAREAGALDLADVVLSGKRLLRRQGASLVESGGQRRFDFDAEPQTAPRTVASLPASRDELLRMAGELEEEGRLGEAAEMCRAALAAGGPEPALCFQLAELLYRQGDLSAARERYAMAVELDEEYLEARTNLACVLAEQGQTELARAAFEGVIALAPEFPDGHYHLARLLDDSGQHGDADPHWRRFLELAPDSPWAAAAAARLQAFDEELPAGP